MEEGTYWARVQRIAHMMDVRTAFVTDRQLQQALELLKAHEAGGSQVPRADLEAARKIKEAVVHPDTGETIFAPLRLSFIVPCNLVLDFLMLSARGPLQNVAAQWLNQTYNSLHYYANRNASNEESVRRIAEAYAGATASSVGAALGLNALCDRVPPSRRWAPVARRLIPFCAVAAADILNLGITRRNEFLEGINVYDPERGDLVGHSRAAGLMAVGACVGGRIAAAAPILVGPPLVMHRLESMAFFAKRPLARTAALLGMIGASIQVCVPLFFGIFKQKAAADVRLLEPHLHSLVGRDGRPLTHVAYNKGI